MNSEVIFEDDAGSNHVGNIQSASSAPTGMLGWLMKNKIIESTKQGEQLLLGIVIVAVILGIGVYLVFGITYQRARPQVTSMPGPSGTLVPISNP